VKKVSDDSNYSAMALLRRYKESGQISDEIYSEIDREIADVEVWKMTSQLEQDGELDAMADVLVITEDGEDVVRDANLRPAWAKYLVEQILAHRAPAIIGGIGFLASVLGLYEFALKHYFE
jgi:hypothetical protein